MPQATAFHESTSSRCKSMYWKEWAGYYAVRSYDTCHEREYFAIRHGVALIDVSPLFKYEVKGKDAGAFLSYLTVKDVTKLKEGSVTYLCWCDDNGHVLDDGTVTRISEDHYRLTSADPAMHWLLKCKRKYDVSFEDISAKMGALAVQGPNSKLLLSSFDPKINDLKFFKYMTSEINGIPVEISRTGYTGDLGYEVWVKSEDACKLYEYILEQGVPFHTQPVGLDAMDISRIEAGFILNGVDYFSARHCMIDERKSNPYEIGLGWCVKVDREPFIGQKALKRVAAYGPKVKLVGLEVDWLELEAAFAKHNLPPEVCPLGWRDGKPVYDSSGSFIGRATSGAWSPTLKKNLALASIPTKYANVGQKLRIEATVEYERVPIAATVVPMPFFNPERKRA